MPLKELPWTEHFDVTIGHDAYHVTVVLFLRALYMGIDPTILLEAKVSFRFCRRLWIMILGSPTRLKVRAWSLL